MEFWVVNIDFILSIVHRQFLPHAKFPVFITSSSSASGGWDIVPRSLVPKIAPKHRTCPTYNISEARAKRISRSKVVLILLLKFIVDTHGSNYDTRSCCARAYCTSDSPS